MGLYVLRRLIEDGHNVTIFTRGNTPIPSLTPDISRDTPIVRDFNEARSSIEHLKGNRHSMEDIQRAVDGRTFDAVYDTNMRTKENVETVITALDSVGAKPDQYIICSSAGVYADDDEVPHFEGDATDPTCRHAGKIVAEKWLRDESGIEGWTSIRPVYIYGPRNYNPVEGHFFSRIYNKRPMLVPRSGMQVTQMGHNGDLAAAFVKCLGNSNAAGQIINCSGERSITFDGMVRAAARAMDTEAPEIIHYQPWQAEAAVQEWKVKHPNADKPPKIFPYRDCHYFTDIQKAKKLLDWEPKIGLDEGLRDCYQNDFLQLSEEEKKGDDFTLDNEVVNILMHQPLETANKR